MSAVIDAIGDLLEDAWDAVTDFVKDVWDEIAMPILEEVFSWIGIEDETVVHSQKVSSLIFGDNNKDVVKHAIIKAIFAKIKSDSSFFPHYMAEMYRVKGQTRAYYRYGETGQYIHGLPDMTVKGGDIDLGLVGSSLDTDLGTLNTVLTADTRYPSDEMYFHNALQAAPELYLPYANTLTHTDIYGGVWSDWTLDSITYNIGPADYSIGVSRTAEQALFWLRGPAAVTEGESATFTVYCNRPIPVGKTVTVNFTYGGTAPGTDYTSVASVVMTAGLTEIDVVIATAEDALTQGNRTLILTIDSITNTGAAFETVGIWTMSSVTTTIHDDEGVFLTLEDAVVAEDAVSLIVPVKLEAATAGAFTVDYTFTDIETIGGTDYDNTGGTLNFAGTLGEVQNITIPITADVADDDFERFQVGLLNCSDGTVDITRVATITIVDGTATEPVPTTVLLEDIITKPSYVSERTLIVTYHDNTDPPEEWFIWHYVYSTLTYPGLDPSLNILSGLEMLPVAILRKDKVSISVDKLSQEYLTTRSLMQRLGFRLDDFIDALEDNPDIGAVDDAYVNFAMGPNTVNKVISKMLYLTFYEIVVTHGLTSNLDQFSATFLEGDVNNAMVWIKHTYTPNVVGVVTTVGEYLHTPIAAIEEVTDAFGNVTIAAQPSKLFLRWQKTGTTYDELEIKGLNSMAAIAYGGYHKASFQTLTDSNFTIPVSWYVYNQLDAKEQLEVYQYLLRFDVYALTVQEIAWYQTSGFLDLFEFVMVVITIWTLGSTGSFFALIEQLVVNYAIAELVIWVAETTGNAELAAIVGLVATIALGGMENYSFGDALTGEILLDLSTSFADNLTLSENAIAQELGEDLQEVNAQAEEKMGESTGETVLTPEFVQYLKSIDTTAFPAIEGQYSFDQLYNYDNLVGNFHDTKLQIGVV